MEQVTARPFWSSISDIYPGAAKTIEDDGFKPAIEPWEVIIGPTILSPRELADEAALYSADYVFLVGTVARDRSLDSEFGVETEYVLAPVDGVTAYVASRAISSIENPWSFVLEGDAIVASARLAAIGEAREPGGRAREAVYFLADDVSPYDRERQASTARRLNELSCERRVTASRRCAVSAGARELAGRRDPWLAGSDILAPTGAPHTLRPMAYVALLLSGLALAVSFGSLVYTRRADRRAVSADARAERAETRSMRAHEREEEEAAARRRAEIMVVPGSISGGPTAPKVTFEYKVHNVGQMVPSDVLVWHETEEGEVISTGGGGTGVILEPGGAPVFMAVDVIVPRPAPHVVFVSWNDREGAHRQDTGLRPHSSA